MALPAAARMVAAARACVGTPFRPGGRVPGLGLDCVGVVLVAAAALGVRPAVPAYRLGGDHDGLADALLAAAGARRLAAAQAADGDILVMMPGPRLIHLGIRVGGGLVHAHAGLGRVVEGPMDGGWQLRGVWRLEGVE